MSYKENNDYININLKRAATEDEIQVLNKLWELNSSYRYFKGIKKSYKKFPPKDILSEECPYSISVKGYELLVNSCKIKEAENLCLGIQKSLKYGLTPDALLISAYEDNPEKFNVYGEYFHKCGIPTIALNVKSKDRTPSEIFTLSLTKKNNIKRPRISNGLNVVIVGEPTNPDINGSVPGPFIQKELCDLVSDAYKSKVITAVQPCENGIFPAVVSLIKRGQMGMFLNIDNLHKTTEGLPAWKYLNSETGERLLFCVPNRKLVEFLKLVDKYELPFSIIGKVDKSKSIKVICKNLQVIHLNKNLILNPISKVGINAEEDIINNCVFGENITAENVTKIIENKAFQSKKMYYNFFNTKVGNKTSYLSKETGIGELWYPEIKQFISCVVCSDYLQIKYNTFVAGQNIIFEAARKLVAFGHKPIGVYVNCSFDFSKSNSFKRLNDLVKGINFAARKLNLKILNIDYYDTEKENISVMIVGKKKKREKLFVPYFENAQNVYVIGKLDDLPSTSAYQEILNNNVYPHPDEVNSRFEKRLIKCVNNLQKENLISSIIPVERYGIAGALIKALAPKKLGFKCVRKDLNLNYMFNEIQSRFLVAANKDIAHILKKYKIPYLELGKTKTADFIEFDRQKIPCDEFYSKYFNLK